jgi:hypothetical protein
LGKDHYAMQHVAFHDFGRASIKLLNNLKILKKFKILLILHDHNNLKKILDYYIKKNNNLKE